MIGERRLSAAEVVAKLRAEAGEYRSMGKAAGDDYDRGAADGHDRSANFVEQHLVPRWHAEPTGDGWYWVRGIDVPCWVELTDDDNFADNGKWSFTGFGPDGDGHDYRPLNGRRVCPISGPPSYEKGGAA